MWPLIVVVCSVILLYLYLTHNFEYWNKRGIAGPKPTVLVGNFGDIFLFKRSIGHVCSDLYQKYAGEKCIGIFNARKPVLMPRDPELIRHFLIKDFTTFADRGVQTSNEQLGTNLFTSDGESWKILRKNLTPVFTSGKLKNMFYLVEKCAADYQKYTGELVDKKQEIEFKELTSKYTLDVICSCAFGIEIDALKVGTNSFEDMGKLIFKPSYKIFFYRILDAIFPGILSLLNLPVDAPGVVEFFDSLVKQIVTEREGKPKLRQDFMDLILNLREQGIASGGRFHQEDSKLVITDRIIASQAFVFFAAGFETSSSTMAFMAYELALQHDIQEKLRKEINEISAKYNGITYEAIQEMRYMEMVFSETLRKYPIIEALNRQCGEAYEIPGTKITIDKGVDVIIPVFGLHHDPLYYPEPEKFDPMRFAPENKQPGRPYMPFGDGPRNCIGLRFAKVQSMMGMASFLQKFGVRPSPRTKPDIEFDPRALVLSSVNGIWLDIYRLP